MTGELARGLATLLLAGGGAYALVAAALWLGQGRMIYFPQEPGRMLESTPAALGLAHEEVALLTGDGVRLHGWYVPAPRSRASMLFFHGNAGNVSHRLESLRLFHELGLDVLIVDYRGYGRSEGSPDEQGTYRDAAAAWRHLADERRVAPERIVLFGRSLGGAVAAWLAEAERPAALVMESTFTSVPDVAAQRFPWLPVRRLARYRYDSLRRMAGVECPVLVMHSRDDEMIPFEHGERLHGAAGERAAPLVALRGSHSEAHLASGEAYREALDAFLTPLFGRR